MAKLLRGANFEAYEARPAWAYSDTSEWAHAVSEVTESLWPVCSALPEPLRTTELSHLEKGQVNWRYTGLGRMVFSEPFHASSKVQAERLRPYLRRIGLRYVDFIQANPSVAQEWVAKTKIIVSSQKGAPTYDSGTNELAATELAAASGFHLGTGLKDVLDFGKAASPVGLLILMLRRLQAARKPSPYRIIMNGEIVDTGTEEMLAKVREVKAVPFILNWALSVPATVLKQVNRATSPVAHGDLSYAKFIASQRRFLVASDMSTFDDTISIETLELWEALIFHPVLDALVRVGALSDEMAEAAKEVNSYVQRCPIICPPRHLGEDACIVEALGGVRSGEYLTSMKDTDIRKAFMEAKADEVGIGDMLYSVFGDDAIFGSNDKHAAWKWASTGKNFLDFVENIDLEPSFLMRRIPEGYAYLARQAMRCINREAREEPDSLVKAALAIQTRFLLLAGHPRQDCFYPALLRVRKKRFNLAVRMAMETTPRLLLQLAAQESSASRPLFVDEEELERAQQAYGSDFAAVQAMYEFDLAREGIPYPQFMTSVEALPMITARRRITQRAFRRKR